MSKTITIIGITGIQGGSVANVFLNTPGWTVRGLTRNTSTPKALELTARGVELFKGDLTDAASVKAAVQGSHVVFGNTTFNHAAVVPTDAYRANAKPGQSVRDFFFEEEVEQGRNIADAAATVEELELYVWSSVSSPKKWSKGKYMGLENFESKAAVWEYIQEAHPGLAKKTSQLQMGMYATNWRWGAASFNWVKQDDGSFVLRLPGDGPYPFPFVVPSDAGYYVRALTQVPPGKNLLACSARLTLAEYVKLWSSTVGVRATYEPCTIEEHAAVAPGGWGDFIGQMYAYAAEFGYCGEGDPTVVFPENLGVEIQRTSLEEFFRSEDWSRLLN